MNSSCTNIATISGVITGNIPQEIYYTIPIDNICSYAFAESAKVDSLGRFSIDVDLESSSFIHLYTLDGMHGILLAENGKDYHIDISSNKRSSTFKVVNSNPELHELINSILTADNIRHIALEFVDIPEMGKIKETLNHVKNIELQKFEELKEQNLLSEDMYKLIKLDRECFYKVLHGTIASLKHPGDYKPSEKKYANQIFEYWEQAFSDSSEIFSVYKVSPWSYKLLDNYLLFKQTLNDHIPKDAIDKLYNEGKYHRYKIEQAKKYLKGPNLEFYYISYLTFAVERLKYEHELIELFEDFKELYPDSRFGEHLQKEIDDIKDYHIAIKDDFSSDVIFIKETETIDSLKDLFTLFKGRKIYVDVWATWCAPCIKEFAHNFELKRALKEKGFEALYISIDIESREQKWKDLIKFYKLGGHHIRVSKELNRELSTLYGPYNGKEIPWYFILNEESEVVNNHASAPSDLENLMVELSRVNER